jgi:hypothetical protein
VNEPKFRLAFKGEIAPGAEIGEVKEKLCALFKTDQTRIETLFSGKTTILKKDIPEDEALKLKTSFEKTGALAVVEPVVAQVPPMVTESKDEASLACPKCGAVQAKAATCIRCGIVFEKIRKRPDGQVKAPTQARSGPGPAPGTTQSSLFNEIIPNLIIAFLGIITCSVTAALLYGIETIFGFAVYTWTLWLVLPVGAVLSGYASAMGLWAGAKILNQPPGRLLMANMILVAFETFFLVNYIAYYNLTVDGVSFKTAASFWQYLDATLTHSSLSFRINAREIGTSGELGAFGYLYALLQLAGFAGGGLSAYVFLTEGPYCYPCRRYFRRESKTQRFTGAPDLLDDFLSKVTPLITSGDLSGALAALRAFGNAKAGKNDHILVEATIWCCKRCEQCLLRLTISKHSSYGWQEIPELKQESALLKKPATHPQHT